MKRPKECVFRVPPFDVKWQTKYFFNESAFILGSRETWIAGDEFDFNIHPALNNAKSKHAKCINDMCQKYGFRKGVPSILAEREEFNSV